MKTGETVRRLIRETEWASTLYGHRSGRSRTGWRSPWAIGVLVLYALAMCSLAGFPLDVLASGDHTADPSGHHHHSAAASPSQWEGSPEGKAYSERNHHLAGFLVLLIGVSELRPALGLGVLAWTRLLLPLSFIATGLFLLIWSDHEAWPIGSFTLAQTLRTDPEMLQHKVYGVLALSVGVIEWLRRQRRISHSSWAVPLPLFAVVGGLMLFAHSHGVHPAAHKIHLHHTVMGILAISAGSSKILSGWRPLFRSGRSEGPSQMTHPIPMARFDLLWALLVLAIGLQLLFYSE